jgi:hypothetical protein
MNSRLPSELQSGQFLESGNSFGGNFSDWHDLKISHLKFEISNLLTLPIEIHQVAKPSKFTHNSGSDSQLKNQDRL